MAITVLANAQTLRDLLDHVNESGADDRVSGMDAIGQPFLAALTGPYASGVRVIVCDPDDVERDQGPHCDDCGQATTRDGLEVLHYPVTVLYREV